MQNGQCCATDTHAHHHCKRVSWAALFAGALVGIGLSFLLNLLAMALGLTLVATGNTGVMLATGGLVGIAISTIISMFFAGMTAGCLGYVSTTQHKCSAGMMYGFVTWTLVLFLSAFFAAHLGSVVAHYSQLVTNQATINMIQDQASPAMAATMRPDNTTLVMVNTQKATHALSYTSFVMFALFALGAIASCVGGVCGVRCKAACCKRECA